MPPSQSTMRSVMSKPLLVSVCLGVAFASDEAAAATPTSKVIEMLNDMSASCKAAKNDEEVEFSKFKQFCSGTIARKDTEVEDGTALIAKLAAMIEKNTADIEQFIAKIKELNELIDTSNAGLKKAKDQKEKDMESHSASIADYAESVDALERAIHTLKQKSADQGQAGSMLLQLTGPQSKLPEQVRRTLTAFVEVSAEEQGPDEMLFREAPEANAYESQSGGLIELLQKLRKEFIEKRSDSEKEKINCRHAADMLMQDLTDTIENAKTDISRQEGFLQETKEAKAKNTEKHDITVKDVAEATQYVADLRVECSEKQKSFQEKQGLRAEELEAIGKAIEILSSDDVAGAAEKHLPTLSQTDAKQPSSALAQLRAVKHGDPSDATRRALAGFMKGEGKRLKSHAMNLISERIAAGNPFTKVKQMIEDLIHKLLEEINQETEQKGWCDKELGVNTITRKKLTDDIEDLTGKLDENEAALDSMSQRIALLSKEVSELASSMEEASQLRADEKAKNAATVEDAKKALSAVDAATAVLKDFYAKAGTATALLQVSAPGLAYGDHGTIKMGSSEWTALADGDDSDGVAGDEGHREGEQTFGKAYKGDSEAGGSVLAMLDVIRSDFARLEAETSSSEEEAANEHATFITESEKSSAVKSKEIDMLNADKTKAEAERASMTRDLKDNQDQMLAAERVYAGLKPTCVDTGLSYEDRAKAREEEIQSLQEALGILKGEDLGSAV